jgi:hypothetical protein
MAATPETQLEEYIILLGLVFIVIDLVASDIRPKPHPVHHNL